MKLYQKYFLENKDKIHPELKTAGSWYIAGPGSDVTIALASGGKEFKNIKNVKSAFKVGKHMGKNVLIGLGAYTVYRVIRSMFDKCEQKCGLIEINNPKRQLCKLNCKKLFLQKTIQELRKRNEKQETINKLNDKLNVVNKKIILYKKYLANKK